MPKFSYEALDSRGKLVTGTIEALNRDVVFQDLKAQRYVVKSIREQASLKVTKKDFLSRFSKVSLYVLAIFTRQFAVLFNAGLSMTRSLEALTSQSLSPKLTQTIENVSTDVKNGFSLSRALAKHPDVFSPVYISLVKAGEMAGALGDVLDRLATLMERDNTLRKKVASAMTYPIFVMCIAIVVVVGLVLYIFPQFMVLFEGLGSDLPIYTKILIVVVRFAIQPMFIALTFVIGVLVWLIVSQYVRTPLGKRHKDFILLEFPIVGPINKKTVISRFCRTLSTLVSSGVPIIHSLEIVSRAVGNEIVSGVLDNVKSGLKAGLKLSQPMAESKLFPPIVSNMVAVGEETGNLATLLDKLATYYDMEVEYALSAFASVIEPMMIFFLGGVIGFVLLAVFSPIYALVSHF